MASRSVRRRGLSPKFCCALAGLAVAANAGAQSIEDRAAEVVRSLEAPPPVETVIERGRVEVGPSMNMSTTPSRAPAGATTHQPMRTPPEFLKRLERLYGRPGPTTASGIQPPAVPTPGLVQTPGHGTRLQGTANPYTGGKISGRP
jgi:hypothetical protein